MKPPSQKSVVRQTASFEPAPLPKLPPPPLQANTLTVLPPLPDRSAPSPLTQVTVAPADPMIEASRRAPLMALNKTGVSGAHVSPAVHGHYAHGTDIEADDKGAFERRLKPPRLEGAKAGLLGDLNMVVPQGTAIPCTLETAMQSNQPGFVSCVIPRDVLSANGRVVLMERGTQVVGEYRGGLKQGQVRLHVLWSRARRPSGLVVELASAGTDELGRAGVAVMSTITGGSGLARHCCCRWSAM